MGSLCVNLSLIEFTVDCTEGSKNPETCVLYTRGFRCQFISSVSARLPRQCQPPGLQSNVGIIVSWRPKLDVLIRMLIRSRKHLLHPFVELLRERCYVFGGVEFRILQLLCLQVR